MSHASLWMIFLSGCDSGFCMKMNCVSSGQQVDRIIDLKGGGEDSSPSCQTDTIKHLRQVLVFDSITDKDGIRGILIPIVKTQGI